MQEKTNNKTIAKNTAFLYFRMMFTMVVALFTSRVVLQKLGVEDYGIYHAVGGIVGFLSFLNSALSTGSSRFLTYELGTGNFDKLKRVFSTTLTIHIILALLIVLLAETIGLWFLYNKMMIPEGRLNAAVWTFHISILTAVFTLTQVPYNASIISHERMSVFAYMSIYEVSAKLGIVYLLTIGTWDKLEMYATLLFIVQMSVMVMYRAYCGKHFAETKYTFTFDKKIFKDIASFSGWSLFANGAIALNGQGILLLLNMFFSPSVVAARAISIQVNMAINQFVHNFRTATNPQIVKRFASGDVEGSKNLLLSSTKYSYYMMFILCFPICMTTNSILKLWLGEVPEYTVIFLQLILVQSLFQVFDTSFYTALYAKGRLRENALLSPTMLFICFPIVFLLFKHGFSPVVLSWASLVTYMVIALLIKPILIIKIANSTLGEILNVFRPCLIVTILSLPIPLLCNYYINKDSIFGFLLMVSITVTVTIAIIWFVGIEREIKNKILKKIY
ncbi:MAG: MATE family efflux transporter, partial [Prevotellaceae bacterium]|nr:MATE family efflux transporter [Prevotellaceae bacterium]